MQGLNTTSTLVAICQNDKFSFSFLQLTYLGLAQAIPSAMSTLGYWYFQKYFRIRTKNMVRIHEKLLFSHIYQKSKLRRNCTAHVNIYSRNLDTILGYAWDLDQ